MSMVAQHDQASVISDDQIVPIYEVFLPHICLLYPIDLNAPGKTKDYIWSLACVLG